MDYLSLIISIMFVIGLGYMVFLVFSDFRIMVKSFLRLLKPERGFWKVRLILSPIWLPLSFFDSIFNWGIYTNAIKESSKPEKLKLEDYSLYLKIESHDLELIKRTLKKIGIENNDENWGCQLAKTEFGIFFQKNGIVFQIKTSDFHTFICLVRSLGNITQNDKLIRTKGICVNNIDNTNSFYFEQNPDNDLIVIGKSYRNKSLYIETQSKLQLDYKIFYNSKIQSLNGFDLKKFILNLNEMKFKDLDIKFST